MQCKIKNSSQLFTTCWNSFLDCRWRLSTRFSNLSTVVSVVQSSLYMWSAMRLVFEMGLRILYSTGLTLLWDIPVHFGFCRNHKCLRSTVFTVVVLPTASRPTLYSDNTIILADSVPWPGSAVWLWVEHCQDNFRIRFLRQIRTLFGCDVAASLRHVSLHLPSHGWIVYTCQRCACWTAGVNDCTTAAYVEGSRSSDYRTQQCLNRTLFRWSTWSTCLLGLHLFAAYFLSQESSVWH